MFRMWRQIDENQRRSLWRLYGWFTALMCIGSCTGAVAWAAYMKQSQLFITSNNANVLNSSSYTPARVSAVLAESGTWDAVYKTFYALEFFCVSVVKLMMLDRMIALALYKTAAPLQRRGVIAGHILTGLVVALNTVGLCGNIVAAVFLTQSADMRRAAAAAWTGAPTEAFSTYNHLADLKNGSASQAAAVQHFAELASLLLIVVLFIVVGGVCASRIAASLRRIDGANTVLRKGTKLRWQIIGSVSVVFVTFLLRAVFSCMYAISNWFQNDRDVCPGLCVSSCQNQFSIIQNWITLTPEFQLLVVLISSPLALGVALWGMTSDSTVKMMTSRNDGAMLTARIVRSPTVDVTLPNV